jgi:energy-coupling factor transport system permease protein
VWALGLGAAASRTTNPLLLALLATVAGVVVAACRTAAPWARSYGVFLRLGLVVVLIRTAFHVLLGGSGGTTVLFRLPEVPLPAWAEGVRIGGAVTAEGLVAALQDGLRIGVILVCVGAANALANPRRMLRSLPAALYEVSVAAVVGMSVAPQLATSAGQLRRARLLRGDTTRGWRSIRSLLAPVLEDALDRSLTLAASMDSRGYGRTAGVPAAIRHATSALVLSGLVGMCLGSYGLLDGEAPAYARAPALVIGATLAVAGLALGSTRVRRSRYRPDVWDMRSVLVALSGIAAFVAVFLAARHGNVDVVPPFAPLRAPRLPLVPVLGALAALAPVALTRPAP